MTPIWRTRLVVFCVGVVVGIGGTWASLPYVLHRRWDSHRVQARLLERFSSKLTLTTDQRARVAKILEAKRQKVDALRADIRPKFQEIRTSTAAEIRQLLTPDQQRTFDAMNAEFEARAKRFRERFHETTQGMPGAS